MIFLVRSRNHPSLARIWQIMHRPSPGCACSIACASMPRCSSLCRGPSSTSARTRTRNRSCAPSSNAPTISVQRLFFRSPALWLGCRGDVCRERRRNGACWHPSSRHTMRISRPHQKHAGTDAVLPSCCAGPGIYPVGFSHLRRQLD
jgi:hypothetical protein